MCVQIRFILLFTMFLAMENYLKETIQACRQYVNKGSADRMIIYL